MEENHGCKLGAIIFCCFNALSDCVREKRALFGKFGRSSPMKQTILRLLVLMLLVLLVQIIDAAMSKD
ncbi:hypothetical protein SDJN02_07140, partial [Cucurbita argyrosperma subsp. argyrosperma]